MEQREVAYAPKLIGDLLAIIHNAIIVIDSGNRIILANSRAAKMFRTTVDVLQCIGMTQLFMPEDRDLLAVNILTLTREQGEFEGEAMLKRPDGSHFLGLLAGTFFRWSNKESGMAFTIHDISDVKALEHSLKESERIAYLGRLINDISHQLRNPVSVIGGFARRLEAEGIDPVKVGPIITEVDKIEDLLATVGKFIKLPKPSLGRIQLGTFIAGLENRLQKIVRSHGCRWQGDYEQEIMEEALLADKELLFEAFEAIVVNACESYTDSATQKNVIFRVRYNRDADLPFVVSIIDQGMGISDENLPNVFAHFFSNKTHHVGLGLTFACRILEEQMGRITVSSIVGQGTTVTIKLVRERRRPIRSARLK